MRAAAGSVAAAVAAAGAEAGWQATSAHTPNASTGRTFGRRIAGMAAASEKLRDASTAPKKTATRRWPPSGSSGISEAVFTAQRQRARGELAAERVGAVVVVVDAHAERLAEVVAGAHPD